MYAITHQLFLEVLFVQNDMKSRSNVFFVFSCQIFVRSSFDIAAHVRTKYLRLFGKGTLEMKTKLENSFITF